MVKVGIGKAEFVLTKFRLDQGWTIKEFCEEYLKRFGDMKLSPTQQFKHLHGQVLPHPRARKNYVVWLNEYGYPIGRLELTRMFRERRAINRA